ncbi:putative secondary metabolism biosynthetic enzyme [Aspergillus puulaauensis]|uniref:Aspartate aminotransferase n=1 Tax=Aspergillus puulaauensis TaxID=1220207 RepID=A0A7R7XIS4_9EURO|nr:putative secondary metabolism biosynthetic enzyme [Aspergillus puulaauensis]BCS21708.1 putative secondary metabolism biosynthetic enzyme [Aspergillus puulaauensis]
MERQYLNLQIPPPDTAFGLMADFEADPHPHKVSLVAGAYRDENGKPWVLPSVRKAKVQLSEASHEYLGIEGSPRFLSLAKHLIFGPLTSRLTTNFASIQTVSGTGANHLAAAFLARYLQPKRVFIPSPTWINHRSIWEMAGVEVTEYPYYSPATKEVDMEGMLAALSRAERNDVIVLQACAHNPTGVDLTKSQWVQVADLMCEKRLFTVFDSAYQGFATGDVDEDAWAVRQFTEMVLDSNTYPGLCVAQSFSKNFGLYGERVGALHLVVPLHLSAQGARGELMAIARVEYSNPPRFGPSIVETVLGGPELRAQWEADLDTMSSRIRRMRRELRQRLEKETGKDWSYVERQIGMFSYTGLGKDHVARLRDEFHVYLLPSGRLSVCGLNDGNVQYVAHAISQVMKD